MDLISRDDLGTLLGNRRTPCISMFMPTTRGAGHEDSKRWKNLVREVEKELKVPGLPASEVKELLRPAQAMLEDGSFWQNVSHGLAVFISPETLRSFRLPMAVDEQVIVGERFHLRPVLPLMIADGRFYILALSQKSVRLLHATRHTVGELKVPGMPRSFQEALNYDDVEVSRTVHSHPSAGGPAGSREAIAHGHGAGIDSAKEGLLEFVSKVSRFVERLLANEDSPLALAGVEYELAIYRQVNKYKHLATEEVDGNPEHLSLDELRDRAWGVVQPYFQEARQRAAALYRQMGGTGRTANDLIAIVTAAYQGQIQSLFVPMGPEPQTAHWGRFDTATGKVVIHDRPEPGDEDLVNLTIVHVLGHKGMVYSLEPGEIPGQPPVAAIFWLPAGERSSKRVMSDE